MVWTPPQVDSGKAGFFFSVTFGTNGGFVSSLSGGNTLVISSAAYNLVMFYLITFIGFFSKVF